MRDLALFNLAIDNKLRGCDLVALRVSDVTRGSQVLSRTAVFQRKTQRPVQFELTEPTRTTVATWIEKAKLKPEDFFFPSRLHDSPHVSTRQYARIVEQRVTAAGLDPAAYDTHSMRRTKNLRAVQLLLGHSKLETTVRYLGIDVDDAFEISEQARSDRGGGHPPKAFERRVAAYGCAAGRVVSGRSRRPRSNARAAASLAIR